MPNRLIGFDFPSRTRIVFGPGLIDQLGELAREQGGKRALLVTDQGIVRAGHADRGRQSLEKTGLNVTIFDQVEENPTTRDVDACLAVAKASNIDILIGLGGGSSMDTAKGCNFLLTNGGHVKDYWGVNKAAKPMLPMIAVPTTAGTGSECQSFALIADAESHLKMACGDWKAAPCIALLDPELTLTQPRLVTADTGVDALTHAVESMVTTKRNEISTLFSRDAFKLVYANLAVVLNEPDNLMARGRMQLGAAYAGMAIEASMLGGAHAAANPLTAHYDVIHGQAVGLMLPHVMRFNANDSVTCHLYDDLARAARLADNGMSASDAAHLLIDRVEALMNIASIPKSAIECGVEEDMIPTLADEAASQWTGSFNPRKMGVHDFESLYQAAMVPRQESAGSLA